MKNERMKNEKLRIMIVAREDKKSSPTNVKELIIVHNVSYKETYNSALAEYNAR